jgi:hypothetical protein
VSYILDEMSPSSDFGSPGTWTFLSNYTHVLVCLARNPDTRLRDIATSVGITERAAQRIVGDLEAAGVITRTKDGRRNHYEIELDAPLRHPLECNSTVGNLLSLFLEPREARALGLRSRARARARSA